MTQQIVQRFAEEAELITKALQYGLVGVSDHTKIMLAALGVLLAWNQYPPNEEEGND